MKKLLSISGIMAMLLSGPASALNFTVNSSDNVDDGVCDVTHCSLREAIDAANANVGLDTIAFNVAGGGAHTINISDGSLLPTITDSVVLDGTTQPGFSGTPLIEIAGPGRSTHFIGGGDRVALKLTSGNSTVKGLTINRFDFCIILETNGNNVVEGNFLGTDSSGTQGFAAFPPDGGTLAPNTGIGVLVNSNSNLIGGATSSARNILSGLNDGLDITGNSNQVKGNFIGTDIAGMQVIPFVPALGTTGSIARGIAIYGNGNSIGGSSAAARNVISGNWNAGIIIIVGTGNQVSGNYIGTDVTGMAALSNDAGVSILAASNNMVGGDATVGSGNLISGNGTGVGVGVGLGGLADNNTIQGNVIGNSAAGVPLLGSYIGVALVGDPDVANTVSGNLIGGSSPGLGNIITGASERPGPIYPPTGILIAEASAHSNTIEGNVISSNDGSGITVTAIYGDQPDRNAILGNAILGNQGLGIDLGNDGVTLNDLGDGDSGANLQQNFPVLTSAVTSPTETIVNASLDSSSSSEFRVEIFTNGMCNGSGHGEGELFQTFATVMTNGTGHADFSIVIPASEPGQFVTATATDAIGNTSEFSQCVQVVPTVSVIEDTVADLPIGVFGSAADPNGQRNSLQNRLMNIQQDIEEGDLAQALDELRNLRRRVDGCEDAPPADSNDWINDCDAQDDVRNLIDLLIAHVEALLASG